MPYIYFFLIFHTVLYEENPLVQRDAFNTSIFFAWVLRWTLTCVLTVIRKYFQPQIQMLELFTGVLTDFVCSNLQCRLFKYHTITDT